MKIITILGSPRKSGNTARILKAFETAAVKHDITRINITDYKVQGCRGCDACQKQIDIPGCKLHDDFEEIAHQILSSDLVIYATAVYVWDFTAQMKALMDRHYCLVKWKNNLKPICLLENKRTALLATCGGDISSNTDLIQEIFKREMEYLHCNPIGSFFAQEYASTSEMKKESESLAREMARQLLE